MLLVARRNHRGLVPWDPFSIFGHESNRFFEGMRREFSAPERNWSPALDVTETETAYVVEADIPGLDKDDVKIEVLGNTLTIQGERKHETEKEEGGFHRIERHCGSFHRSIEVPAGFDEGKIEAKFENGVLQVTLPKHESAKPKQIAVEVK